MTATFVKEGGFAQAIRAIRETVFRPRDWQTELSNAVIKNDAGLARNALLNGADPLAEDLGGWRPIEHVIPLDQGVILDLLIGAIEKKNPGQNERMYTSLLEIAAEQNALSCARVLIGSGATPTDRALEKARERKFLHFCVLIQKAQEEHRIEL